MTTQLTWAEFLQLIVKRDFQLTDTEREWYAVIHPALLKHHPKVRYQRRYDRRGDRMKKNRRKDKK